MQKNDIYTIIINLERLNNTLEEMTKIHKENRKIAKDTRQFILDKMSEEDYMTEGARGEEILVKATETIVKTDDMYKKMAELITRLKVAELLKDFGDTKKLMYEENGINKYEKNEIQDLPVSPGSSKSDLLEELNKNDS